jgi:hypothetical protein
MVPVRIGTFDISAHDSSARIECPEERDTSQLDIGAPRVGRTSEVTRESTDAYVSTSWPRIRRRWREISVRADLCREKNSNKFLGAQQRG